MPGKQQATHNEKLCDHLIAHGQSNNGEFADWVITTAFYSAIHLVDHQIFPLQIDVQPQYANLAQYMTRLNINRAKHEVRRDLVSRYIPKAYGAFSWLMDECHNARYNNYQVPPEYVQRARGCLDSIKKHCPRP
jgi:hypothetical protein